MAKKLFVGNLSWGTTNDQLQDLFSQAGTVSEATVIVDNQTGRSKGFGFVSFDNDEEADKAIAQFNGYEHDGRALTVNEARPKEDRPPRRNFGGDDRRRSF